MGRVAAVAQVHRRLYTSQDLKSVVLNQYLDACSKICGVPPKATGCRA